VKSGFHRWIKCNRISKQGYKEVLGEENRKKIPHIPSDALSWFIA